MKFTPADLSHATNLITALKKAKFELEGLEVLALAEVMRWVGGLHKTIKEELEPPKPVGAAVVPTPAPVIEEPVAEVQPEKKTRKPKQ